MAKVIPPAPDDEEAEEAAQSRAFAADQVIDNPEEKQMREMQRQRILMNKLTEENVPMVGVPGGRMIPLTAFAGLDKYAFEAKRAVFTDIHKFIIDALPKEYYAWPIKEDPMTDSLIGSGAYIPVLESEMQPDHELPVAVRTHRGRGDKKFNVLCYGSHMLVRMSDDHKRRMYDAPVYQAALATSRGVAGLKNLADKVGANVTETAFMSQEAPV